MEVQRKRVIQNINIGVYKDQLDNLEDIRSKRRPVPSRAELIREALDEYIERCSQPDLIESARSKTGVGGGQPQ